jgi:hypothetical protein
MFIPFILICLQLLLFPSCGGVAGLPDGVVFVVFLLFVFSLSFPRKWESIFSLICRFTILSYRSHQLGFPLEFTLAKAGAGMTATAKTEMKNNGTTTNGKKDHPVQQAGHTSVEGNNSITKTKFLLF